jgi:heptaprenyl diphosphate synthase/octaprenyl-diphosphate synthase
VNTAQLADLLHLPALDADLVRVERGLEDALTQGDNSPYLVTPGLRVVRGGGKRLRPVLTIAAAASFGTDMDDDVLAGAVACELVHAGSLVHDDIMDDADERRGTPTVNSVEGASHAILVGDFLLARAGELAAGVSKEVAGTLASTIAALCDGQSRETIDLFDLDRTIASFLISISGKTAALMRSSARIGALCGRLPDEAVSALSEFGQAFGMAFQIIDDVLDIVSSAELMGKPVGNDIREGVYTLPVLLALQRDGGERIRTLLAQKPQDPGAVAEVQRWVQADGIIDATLDEARRYNEEAAKALAGLPQNPVVEGLAALPDAYLQWVLDTKVAH